MASRAETLFAAIQSQNLPVEVRRGQWRVRIDSATVDGNRVTINGEVTQSGVPVPISWPVSVTNPPMLVPDRQGAITRTSTNVVTGEEVTTRFREDPWEAMVATFVDLTRQVQAGVI